EGEQELLHLAALSIATVETDAIAVVEHGRLEEAEDRVDAAVVEEPEAAHLVALEPVVARVHERDVRHAEHADLLVEVPQGSDLDDLLLVLEARVAVRAEEAVARVERVAADAVETKPATDRDAVGAPAAGHEVPPRLLIARQGVVDRPDRVRRQR